MEFSNWGTSKLKNLIMRNLHLKGKDQYISTTLNLLAKDRKHEQARKIANNNKLTQNYPNNMFL